MNNGTFLRRYKIINNSEITKVGPVEMQYMCPWGLGIAIGNNVIVSAITYKNKWWVYCIANMFSKILSGERFSKYLQIQPTSL